MPQEFRDLLPPSGGATDEDVIPPLIPPGALFAEFFVDGVRYGDVVVSLDAERLRFDNAKASVIRIADIRQSDDLVDLLDRGILMSDGKMCIVRPGSPCAPPAIGRFGIIVDPQVPRIDLFRSHNFIQPPEPLRPSHPDAIGLIASLTARVSGSNRNGRGSTRGSLSFDVVGGMGATSLFATGSLDEGGELNVRRGGMQHFTGRYRMAAGLFLADPSDHFSQINIVGAEMHTSDLTKPPVDASRDTPVLIFLDTDSYVDVLRGGELLYTQQLPAGPARIPTRNFPAGSYNVDLRIRDQAGNTRSEKRFFSRPNDYARVNQWDFGIQAGITRSPISNQIGFLEDGLAFASFRAERPIGRNLLIGGRLGVIDDLAFAESFVERNMGSLFLRGSGLLTKDGDYSLSALLSGQIEKFSISGQLRHGDIDSKISAFRGQSARYTEKSLNISRPVPLVGGQFSAFARSIDRADSASSTSWGATWDKNVRLFGTHHTNGLFSLGYQRTERDHRVLAGLRLTWQGGRATGSARMRHQFVENRASGETQSQTTQDAQLSLRSNPGTKDRWALTARASHQGEGIGRVGLSGQLQARQLFVDAQIDRSFGDDNALNYFGSVSTSLAISPHGVALSGQRNVDAGILVKFEKTAPDDSLQIRLNSGSKQEISKGLTLIPLAAFSLQNVSFRPERNSSMGFDNVITRVAAFPGNIITIDPGLFRQVSVFGRLIGQEGEGLAQYQIQAGDQYYQTDDEGYFIFDVRYGIETFSVRKNAIHICEVKLPDFRESIADELAILGDLMCM